MTRRAEVIITIAAAGLAAIGVLRCVAIIDAARAEVVTLSAEDGRAYEGRCPLGGVMIAIAPDYQMPDAFAQSVGGAGVVYWCAVEYEDDER
jgi:hypothetical protein